MQVCPSGFYCGNNTITPIICPMGSYCPKNTKFSTQYLCPEGTYSNITGLYDSSECSSCPAGYSCEMVGLIAPTGMCDAGYFCGGGSNTNTPQEVTYSAIEYSKSAAICLTMYGNYSLNGICPPGNKGKYLYNFYYFNYK